MKSVHILINGVPETTPATENKQMRIEFNFWLNLY